MEVFRNIRIFDGIAIQLDNYIRKKLKVRLTLEMKLVSILSKQRNIKLISDNKIMYGKFKINF